MIFTKGQRGVDYLCKKAKHSTRQRKPPTFYKYVCVRVVIVMEAWKPGPL